MRLLDPGNPSLAGSCGRSITSPIVACQEKKRHWCQSRSGLPSVPEAASCGQHIRVAIAIGLDYNFRQLNCTCQSVCGFNS